MLRHHSKVHHGLQVPPPILLRQQLDNLIHLQKPAEDLGFLGRWLRPRRESRSIRSLTLLIIRKTSGVAVGSSIGHAIGGFFGGGSSQAVADGQQSDSALATQATEGNYQSNGLSRSCEPDAKAFTRCLDENKGEYQMSVCGWYLEQLVRPICSPSEILQNEV